MMNVFLRPLTLFDAGISYKWRNNPEVWKFTPFEPNISITPEIESDWLSNVLRRKDEARFAICLEHSGQYIGNVQLINIRNSEADFHLFIGETDCWGKGIGEQALKLMLSHGFEQLHLKRIFLEVNKDNIPAMTIYKRQGFQVVDDSKNYIVLGLTSIVYQKIQNM
jgi:diamine N-acetyltransferase